MPGYEPGGRGFESCSAFCREVVLVYVSDEDVLLVVTGSYSSVG